MLSFLKGRQNVGSKVVSLTRSPLIPSKLLHEMPYSNFTEIAWKQLDLKTPSLANVDVRAMEINTLTKLSIHDVQPVAVGTNSTPKGIPNLGYSKEGS